MSETIRDGGCACGQVRFKTRGEARRAGLCHCMTCRKAHASAFNPFVVFAAGQVDVTGDVRHWESSPGYLRAFCPACGSRVFASNEGEYEISSGSFDRPGEFTPQYESWIIRREPWLPPTAAGQHEKNRFD